MRTFGGRTAVITGAASGIGLETARRAAQEGMNVVMADLRAEALDAASGEIRAVGAPVLALAVDVSRAGEIEALGAATQERFGAPHFVFNNAGVALGGLVWEHSARDWEWLIGVNLLGVAHGVRVFTPMMLQAASADAEYEGHIVNTASMAGLLAPPTMGLYCASKHGVVALTEALYQDLALVSEQVTASVLCPYFIPTGIHASEDYRPHHAEAAPPTKSQLVAGAMNEKAVSSGKVSASQVAGFVFDALLDRRFYIFSHPHALKSVQARLEDILAVRSPTDPFFERPELGEQLREALRG